MNILSYLPFCFAFFALAGPCHAIAITLDPLSSDTNVHGTWHQRHLGSDSGTWFLPGGVLLEIGLNREGSFPDPDPGNIGNGRWAEVSCQMTAISDPVGGFPYGLFFNHVDSLGDDHQFQIKPGSGGRDYTFTFSGSYSPSSDEWFGSFSAMVFQASPVPEGGGSLLLFCAALAGIHGLKRRLP